MKKLNRETYFQAKDSKRLFFQSWEAPKAEYGLLITHGQGEHSGSYHRLAESFADQNCSIYAFDFRGHGKSDGIRGYAKSSFDYLNDFEAFLDLVLSFENRPQKLYLFSHSMGGMIQLLCQTQSRFNEFYLNHFQGQILSSPLTEVAVPVPRWKSEAAKIVNQIFPILTLGNEITDQMLTRDPDVIKNFKKDPLRHQKISSGVFLSFSEVFEILNLEAEKIKLPTVLMVPEDDLVVSTPKSLELLERFGSQDKTKIIFPEARHELVNDVCRPEVFQTMKEHLHRWNS